MLQRGGLCAGSGDGERVGECSRRTAAAMPAWDRRSARGVCGGDGFGFAPSGSGAALAHGNIVMGRGSRDTLPHPRHEQSRILQVNARRIDRRRGRTPLRTLSNGPWNAREWIVPARDFRVGVDRLQVPGAELRQYACSVDRRWPQSRQVDRLLQVQDDPPAASVGQGAPGTPALIVIAGMRRRGRQGRQGVPNLGRHLVGDPARFGPRVPPVVLDLQEPGRVPGQAQDIDRLASAGDGLELVATKGPFLVPSSVGIGQEPEREIPALRNLRVSACSSSKLCSSDAVRFLRPGGSFHAGLALGARAFLSPG